MSLTSAQAIELLRANPNAYATADALRALAAQVDASASGNVTVLYSGNIGNDVHSTQVIKGMLVNGEDIRVIDKTEASKFLDSTDFRAAVARVFDVDFQTLNAADYRGPATDWLYNAKSGPWADASGRFAAATTGEVMTLTPFASAERVFAQTELPALLDNPNVTHIDGLPKDYLLRLHSDALTQGFSETQALDRVRTTVAAASLENAASELEAIDTSAFFEGTGVNGSDLRAGVTARRSNWAIEFGRCLAINNDEWRLTA